MNPMFDAAPELLDACKGFMALLNQLPKEENAELIMDMMVKGNSAIEKAESK